MWDPYWSLTCPATVSLPNFAWESVSAPFQGPTGAGFDPSCQGAYVVVIQPHKSECHTGYGILCLGCWMLIQLHIYLPLFYPDLGYLLPINPLVCNYV